MLKHSVGMLAAIPLLVGAGTAHASLVQFQSPLQVGCMTAEHCGQFVDIGALGFGNAPRLLTLQEKDQQSGYVTPSAGGPVVHGDAISGSDKANTPTIGSLGWTGGSAVAIGYNLNQNANGGGPSLNDLVLTVYDTSFNAVLTFSLDAPTTYTAADYDLQPGNGNGIFGFVLDAPQRLIWNAALLSNTITGSFYIGLGADMGCPGGKDDPTGCQSNDGADTFLALARGTPIINPTCTDCHDPENPPGTPIPGAVWLFGTVLAGGAGFGRWRKKRKAQLATAA